MHPSYINSYGNTSFSTIDQQFSTIDQQWMTSYNNDQTPNLLVTNMHSIRENSSYNNGKFLAADGDNRHVILGKIRSSKKDRHTKINTARGPKDRRMRLSLDVAKKFFRLQDLLGFDKASNTIQWLLMMSQPAIQDLQPQQSNQGHGPSNCPSSASECDQVLSFIDDQSFSSNKEKKRYDNGVRKIVREKARERARKRTTDKKSIKLSCDENTNRLGLWMPFGKDQVQLTDQPEYPMSSRFQFKQGNIVGDSSSMMSSNWSPSFLYNNQHNLGASHEHLGDFHILGKP